MKNLTVVDFAIRAVVSVLAFAATFAAYAASPAQSVTPCTYVGRVMDAEHVGFDTNHVAEISAYENASNRLVATTKTFYQADSRRNYALRIPMASKQVDGALTPGSTVRIEVKEPNGTVWSGLVVDEDAKIGGPGSVKEVDIVLAYCSNEYDIDDELLYDIYLAWYYSGYRKNGEAFDPQKDHDGDGISTVAEVLSGTDPFDPEDCLSILEYKRADDQDNNKDAISFTCRPGRAYCVEVTDSLENPNWQPKAFFRDKNGTAINYLSVPADGSDGGIPTIYLLPQSGPKAFFRIKAN